MRSVEEKIDIPEGCKDDFSREIMNYIGALAIDGKRFDYKTIERLQKALEMKAADALQGNPEFFIFHAWVAHTNRRLADVLAHSLRVPSLFRLNRHKTSLDNDLWPIGL